MAMAAAAVAAAVGTPPASRTAEQGMLVTNNLAVADAEHDIGGQRGTPTSIKRLKNVLKRLLGGGKDSLTFKQLYKLHKEVGTYKPPVYETAARIWSEWEAFEAVTGLKRGAFFSASGSAGGDFRV